MGDGSLLGQGLSDFAPEIKMLIRGGSRAPPPIYLLGIQPPQTHTLGSRTLAEKTGGASVLLDKAPSPAPESKQPLACL